jgi:hypothetical protein
MVAFLHVCFGVTAVPRRFLWKERTRTGHVEVSAIKLSEVGERLVRELSLLCHFF